MHNACFSGISIQVATATLLRGDVPLTTDTAFKFSMYCSTISFLSRHCSMTRNMNLKSILSAEFVLTSPLSTPADRNKHKEATQFSLHNCRQAYVLTILNKSNVKRFQWNVLM